MALSLNIKKKKYWKHSRATRRTLTLGIKQKAYDDGGCERKISDKNNIFIDKSTTYNNMWIYISLIIILTSLNGD